MGMICFRFCSSIPLILDHLFESIDVPFQLAVLPLLIDPRDGCHGRQYPSDS